MRRIWSFRAGVALASLVACTSSGSGQSTDGTMTAGVSEGPTSGQEPTGQGPTGGEPTTDDDPPGPTSSVDPTGGADPTGENPTTGSDTGNDPTGGGGLGPAEFDPDDLDAPSHGGTITFQEIGAPGWYPSRRDPAVGPCDAYE